MSRAALCLLALLATLGADGKTLRAFIAVKPVQSYSPFECAEGIGSDQLNQLYENLFWIDYSGELMPALATGWTRVDPLTIRVTVRRGVRFHNGEELDSEAVKYSLDLFTDPSKKVANRFYGSTLASASIVDKYTVDIRSNVPDGLLQYRLAVVGTIVPPKYVRARGLEALRRHPIGTGPFRFVSADDRTAKLEAYDLYWDGKPAIDALELQFHPSVDEALAKLQTGKLDFVAHVPGRFSQTLSKNPHISLRKQRTLESVLVLMNTKKEGPLRSQSLREAIVKGVNFSHVIKYAYRGNGAAAPSITFPGELFHHPDNVVPEWRPEEARKQIAASGAANHTFKMLITRPFEGVGTIVAQQLRELGLRIEVRYGSDEDEHAAVLEKNQAGLAPQIDFLVSYCSHKFNAFPLLVLFHSRANWSMTDDKSLNRLLDSGVETLESRRQTDLFRLASRYITQHALFLPGVQLQAMYAMRRQAAIPTHVTGHVYFKNATLAGEAK